MINVVIVEDEMLVRLGMKMCIDDNSLSMKVIAAFSSAEEAMEFFDNNSADVLITDIRLINKTGIELIEYIKPRIPGIIIIVLSCYDDFSYARKAYELGADRYLLKHELDSDQLPQIIEETLNKKLIIKKQYSESRIEAEKKPSSGLNQEQYKVCCIALSNPDNKKLVDMNEVSFPMVVEIIQEILNINHMGECYLRHDSEIFCILTFQRQDTQESIDLQIHDFFRQIQTNIQNIFEKDVYMSESNPFLELNEVPKYFNIVRKDLGYCFYYDSSAIIKVPDSKGEAANFEYSVENIVREDGLLLFSQYLNDYFDRQKENWVALDKVKLQLAEFMHEFALHIERYYHENPNLLLEEEDRPNYVNIDTFAFALPLKHWLLAIIEKVKEIIYEKSRKKGNISDIIRFIEENYQKDISLSVIADEFYMNKVYFCQFFKKETGVTYINYLNRYRIEQAKILLKASKDTEETVSNKVGIQNVNYFIRLFKKITNMTIREYRKVR